MKPAASNPPGRLILTVKVKPNARVAALEQQVDGTWLATVKASPVDGKANAALIALIAGRFGVPKRAVTITAGASARLKRVTVDV